MKVLMINGSPHAKGVIASALTTISDRLHQNGVDSEIIQIGQKAIRGCIDCRKCAKTGYCIFTDDPVNECIDKLKTADGFIVGSPVYYAGPNATVCAFLDRLFFMKAGAYAFKPAAAIASARRAGTCATFDRLNKYFSISKMPIVSSQYWNDIFGNNAEEAAEDKEGHQIMETLADNMAWLLKCIEAGKQAGVGYPASQPPARTNFIRQN